MLTALLCAAAAAAAYGVSSVLQAMGVRREVATTGAGTLHLRGVAAQAPFVAGLLLDGVGAVATIIALRHLPLFLVQAAIASSLAVTAVLSARVFRLPLRGREVGAVAVVAIGLVALAASAGPEAAPHTSLSLRVGLLLGAVLVGLLGWLASRAHARGAVAASLLGAFAGVAYGIGNTSLRVIHQFAPTHLLVNPAAYAAVLGGAMGIALFAAALRHGSVTGATAALVAAETVLPATFGLLVLGEHARRGWEPVALLGFACTIGGAVLLGRFGEGEPEQTGHTSRPAPSPRS